jgi:hypothetical protein
MKKDGGGWTVGKKFNDSDNDRYHNEFKALDVVT